MERAERNRLENRLIQIRGFVLQLGKFGHNENYYMEYLAKLENTARAAREDLERSLIQERLF